MAMTKKPAREGLPPDENCDVPTIHMCICSLNEVLLKRKARRLGPANLDGLHDAITHLQRLAHETETLQLHRRGAKIETESVRDLGVEVVGDESLLGGTK